MSGVGPAFWLLAELLWLPIKMVSLDTAGERSLIPNKGKGSFTYYPALDLRD